MHSGRPAAATVTATQHTAAGRGHGQPCSRCPPCRPRTEAEAAQQTQAFRQHPEEPSTAACTLHREQESTSSAPSFARAKEQLRLPK